MKENLQTGFDQLKNSVEITIKVERPREFIGLGNCKTYKPFSKGESFSKLYPHQTENGKQHKGNMSVIATNVIGSQAIAKCVLANCNKTVLLKVKEKLNKL